MIGDIHFRFFGLTRSVMLCLSPGNTLVDVGEKVKSPSLSSSIIAEGRHVAEINRDMSGPIL